MGLVAPRREGATGLTLAETLVVVWHQVLVEELPQIRLGDQVLRVGRTRSLGLRTVAWTVQDQVVEGIEQNPEKPSQWGKLAAGGKRIMQFRARSRYFANVCEGALTRYPAWKGLGLPD